MNIYLTNYNMLLTIFIIYILTKFFVGIYFLIFNKKVIVKKTKQSIFDKNMAHFMRTILILEIVFNIIYLITPNFLSSAYILIEPFYTGVMKYTYILLITLYYAILLCLFDQMSNINLRIIRFLSSFTILFFALQQLLFFIY